jgi:energy-coupling factor transport system substrate-specific component
MNKKLEVKDLITVGLFTALYFVVFFTTGMLGYIPVLMVLIPFLCPMVAGIPFMLFLSKVKKFGMVSLMGTLLGLLMFAFGHPWPAVVFGILFGVAADIILKFSKYGNLKISIIAHAVFSEWLLGSCLSLFFGFREPYFETMRKGYGDVYADKLYALTPDWVFWFMMLLAFVGGIIGALIGTKVLKKHFKKAGIV